MTSGIVVFQSNGEMRVDGISNLSDHRVCEINLNNVNIDVYSELDEVNYDVMNNCEEH